MSVKKYFLFKKINKIIYRIWVSKGAKTQENERNKNKKKNPNSPEYKDAIKKQCERVMKIWGSSEEYSYGFFRILKLLLALSAFVFPGLYVKYLSDKIGYIYRKISIETYVIVKLIIAVLILCSNFVPLLSPALILLTIYLMTETILYLLSLILLSDVYSSPDNPGRSVVLAIINYIEITVDFAILYKLLNLIQKLNMSAQTADEISGLESAYFSFVVSTTAGFGDYIPNTINQGYLLVIVHLCVVWIFVILFMNYFINIFNETRKNGHKGLSIKRN